MDNSLILWALILIAQNASFTWVSRARNSGSDWYHATASVFSNGVWFLAFYFTFDYLDRIHSTGNMLLAVAVGGLYVVCTVFGSVAGGKLVRRFFESGKRQVGHYDKRAEWEAGVIKAITVMGDQIHRHHNDIKLLAAITKVTTRMLELSKQVERAEADQSLAAVLSPETITTEDVERAIYSADEEVNAEP